MVIRIDVYMVIQLDAVVTTLLENGADPHAKTEAGWNALHIAAASAAITYYGNYCGSTG